MHGYSRSLSLSFSHYTIHTMTLNLLKRFSASGPSFSLLLHVSSPIPNGWFNIKGAMRTRMARHVSVKFNVDFSFHFPLPALCVIGFYHRLLYLLYCYPPLYRLLRSNYPRLLPRLLYPLSADRAVTRREHGKIHIIPPVIPLLPRRNNWIDLQDRFSFFSLFFFFWSMDHLATRKRETPQRRGRGKKYPNIALPYNLYIISAP